MTSETFVLLSGALSFGAPLALAMRELVLLRSDGGSPPRRKVPEAPQPTPPAGGHGYSGKLPDSLIPKKLPVRDLEPV